MQFNAFVCRRVAVFRIILSSFRSSLPYENILRISEIRGTPIQFDLLEYFEMLRHVETLLKF